jgi:hypothetical protein
MSCGETGCRVERADVERKVPLSARKKELEVVVMAKEALFEA